MNRVLRVFGWLFSLQPVEKEVVDPVVKLMNGMRVTSKCRYNASVRLRRQSQFSFITTTVLSLGLILIPLLQNSNISLAFPDKVLNMLQVFLAVSVLVYSVIIATARYETRSEALNECGDKIKDLIRSLRHDVAESRKSGAEINLAHYNQRYGDVSTDAENHVRVDFIFASLEMSSDYSCTGIIRIFRYLRGGLLYAVPYFVPVAMIFVEIIFITDMVGVTHILSPYLKQAS